MDKFANVLVFRVADKCFAGQMPNDSGAVVGAMVNVLFANEPQEVLELIVPSLFAAVNRYLAMQYFQFPL